MSKSKYACISAKALAMRARKIDDEDFHQLIKAKDLKDVFLYFDEMKYVLQ